MHPALRRISKQALCGFFEIRRCDVSSPTIDTIGIEQDASDDIEGVLHSLIAEGDFVCNPLVMDVY